MKFFGTYKYSFAFVCLIGAITLQASSGSNKTIWQQLEEDKYLQGELVYKNKRLFVKSLKHRSTRSSNYQSVRTYEDAPGFYYYKTKSVYDIQRNRQGERTIVTGSLLYDVYQMPTITHSSWGEPRFRYRITVGNE